VASALVLIAYLVPWAFGLGLYLSLRGTPKRIEALAVSWAIGWAVINAVTIVVNQFEKIAANETFFGTVTGLLVVPSVVLLVRNRQRLLTLVKEPLISRDLRRGVGLAVVLLLCAFAILVFYEAAITPPVSTDAIVYHMRIPSLAWQTGYLPMNPGIGWLELANTFPNLLETQQLWIYLGAREPNEIFVRPIMPVYTSLLLLIVFDDTRRWFGLPSAALATVCMLSLNEFTSLSTVLWAEVPVAFYSYLAVRVIATEEGLRSRAAAGTFAGMASLTKYNGLPLLLAVALASALLALYPEARGRARAGTARWFVSVIEFGAVIATGLLITSPLLMRNLYFFGNPIYPFIWGGVNTEQAAYYSADFSANDFLRFRLHQAIILLGSILSFAFALGLLRFRSWSRRELLFAITSLLYLPVFLYPALAGSHVRYLAPIIPLTAAFGGRQLDWWLRESGPQGRTVGTVVLLGLSLSVVILLGLADVKPPYLVQYVETLVALAAVLVIFAIGFRVTRARGVNKVAVAILAGALLAPGIFAVVAGRSPPRESALDVNLLPQDKQTFLEGQFGDDWRMWKWINTHLPSDALLLTFEARLFYLERTVIFGSDHVLFPTYGMSLVDAVSFIRALGIRNILDSPWSHIPDVNRIFLQRSVIFQNLDNRSFFQPLHAEGQVILYSIAS